MNGIKCSSTALEESKRLQLHYETSIKADQEKKKGCWKISYLNVRSLNAHFHDVTNDNILMESDVFSLGETWLYRDANVKYHSFEGHFANVGPGKGLATFHKFNAISNLSIHSSECHSVIKISHEDLDLIFVYISNKCDRAQLLILFDILINVNEPTLVIGDFNEKYSEKSNVAMSLKEKRFTQHMNEATHDKGNTIDHLYVNESLLRKGCFTERNPSYYSDHDILSIYVNKK